jgi:hypothetical protein
MQEKETEYGPMEAKEVRATCKLAVRREIEESREGGGGRYWSLPYEASEKGLD